MLIMLNIRSCINMSFISYAYNNIRNNAKLLDYDHFAFVTLYCSQAINEFFKPLMYFLIISCCSVIDSIPVGVFDPLHSIRYTSHVDQFAAAEKLLQPRTS